MGSARTILAEGMERLIAAAVPAIVPPVPAPETKASSFPPVWRIISGPVPWKWASKLEEFSNWSAKKPRGRSSTALRCAAVSEPKTSSEVACVETVISSVSRRSTLPNS